MISSRLDTISSTSPEPRRSRARIPWVALLALLVVGIILYRAATGSEGFDWLRFRSIIQEIDPAFAALAISFIILSYLGRAIRWEIMIRPLGPTPSIWRLFVGSSIGFTAIVLLGRPGEFVRPWWIARESRTPFSAQLAVWLFERIYDLLVVILFFGFGLIHLSGSNLVAKAGPKLRFVIASGGTAALVGAAVCLGLILAIRFLSDTQRRSLIGLVHKLPAPIASRLSPLAENFLSGTAACCDPRLQLLVIFYTFLEWLVIAACYWSVFQAFPFSRSLSFADVITLVGFVSFGAIVQLPGIGGGFQVACIVVLTQLYSMAIEEATSLALFLWALSFLIILPLGLALAFREGLSFSKLSHLDEETA
ncbi:MAG: flippase-like domain-containing protein [Acidobacteria bacterium]|nr:flippase-like domain-containing protein [Acidobacteriota bacterium]